MSVNNPDNITDVHGTPVDHALACESDCINCGEHVDGKPHRLIVAHVTPDGVFNSLEEWVICEHCRNSKQTTLLKYVKLSLT